VDININFIVIVAICVVALFSETGRFMLYIATIGPVIELIKMFISFRREKAQNREYHKEQFIKLKDSGKTKEGVKSTELPEAFDWKNHEGGSWANEFKETLDEPGGTYHRHRRNKGGDQRAGSGMQGSISSPSSKNRKSRRRGSYSSRKQRATRQTNCYSCKKTIDSINNSICPKCKWIRCGCGSCGCGYSYYSSSYR
jgi:hypothetical protein